MARRSTRNSTEHPAHQTTNRDGKSRGIFGDVFQGFVWVACGLGKSPQSNLDTKPTRWTLRPDRQQPAAGPARTAPTSRPPNLQNHRENHPPPANSSLPPGTMLR